MSSKPQPVRRRKHDRSELPHSFLPDGNPAARRGYLFALFGLIPGLGIVCGPLAVILGFIGRRTARRDEQERGKGHAYASRVLGVLEIVCNAAGWFVLASGAA